MTKFYQVMPGLYISGFPTVSDIELHADLDLIVTLSKKQLPKLVSGAVENRYCPIPDGKVTPAREEMYRHAAGIARDWVANGECVLVHCLAGRNRSALVAALAWKDFNSATGEQAYQHIMRVRPYALHNLHFEKYLRGLS